MRASGCHRHPGGRCTEPAKGFHACGLGMLCLVLGSGGRTTTLSVPKASRSQESIPGFGVAVTQLNGIPTRAVMRQDRLLLCRSQTRAAWRLCARPTRRATPQKAKLKIKRKSQKAKKPNSPKPKKGLAARRGSSLNRAPGPGGAMLDTTVHQEPNNASDNADPALCIACEGKRALCCASLADREGRANGSTPARGKGQGRRQEVRLDQRRRSSPPSRHSPNTLTLGIYTSSIQKRTEKKKSRWRSF